VKVGILELEKIKTEILKKIEKLKSEI